MEGMAASTRSRPGAGMQSAESDEFHCIPELLGTRATSDPLASAICAPGRTPLSYGRLWIRVNEIIAALSASGIGRNDRVALVLPNGPDMALAFLGVASAATAAPLNPAYRYEEFDFYLADLDAKALIVPAKSNSPAIAVARARDISVIELSPTHDMEAGGFTVSGPPALRKRSGDLPEPDDVALVLHTSGTTSRPKLVPLTQLNLCASAQSVRDALGLTPIDRCLNVMPLFHIHGLVAAVLASLAAQATVICSPGFYAPEFFGWVDEYRPTWYTAVPTMHQAIVARAPAHRDVIARSPLRFVRSSSAALPRQVLTDLENTFQAPVVEAYGMTEAAHQMASNPLPPQRRKPGSVGLAAGPDVAIMDNSGTLLAAGHQGEVVIRGPNVMRAYENNSRANGESFTNGWFRTGDQGCFDEDGYLFLTGRLKEIINRGGEKISPTEVDDVLMDHPAVAQAVTFAVPDPSLGEDVGVVIVLREGAGATAGEIRDFAAGRLADFKVPRTVLFRSEIPKGATGKLQRIGLAQRLELSLPARSEPPGKLDATPPRSPLEHRLAALWAGVLRIEQPGIHAHFLDLGGDSMLAALLVSQIREELSLELSIRSLFDAPTVADQASVIEGSLPHRVEEPDGGSVRVG